MTPSGRAQAEIATLLNRSVAYDPWNRCDTWTEDVNDLISVATALGEEKQYLDALEDAGRTATPRLLADALSQLLVDLDRVLVENSSSW